MSAKRIGKSDYDIGGRTTRINKPEPYWGPNLSYYTDKKRCCFLLAGMGFYSLFECYKQARDGNPYAVIIKSVDKQHEVKYYVPTK